MLEKTRSRPTRSRDGCLTCRFRKKKCDESKPRCAGCRRNLLKCEWPAIVSQVEERVAIGDSPPKHSRQLMPTLKPSSGVVTDSGQACRVTAHSVRLLQHYLTETISFFSPATLGRNPFATILLPLAYADDLLMHSLLAFSGAHLSFKQPESADIVNATTLHYSMLLSGLRSAFANLDENLEKKSRLLRILMITCHYEALSGNAQGAMFTHLRAGRYLIRGLIADADSFANNDPLLQEALGFSIELYRFLTISNSITPYGIVPDRTLPLDDFITQPIGVLDCSAASDALTGLQNLHQMIVEVSILASQRLDEETNGRSEASTTIRARSSELQNRLDNWTLSAESNAAEMQQDQQLLKAFREGLYVYLFTAMAGSKVTDPVVILDIQDHIDNLLDLAPELLSSNMVASILWPFVIAASCMVKPQQQDLFVQVIQSKRFGMKHLYILGHTMQLLWADPDPRMYGPYGLYLIMERHGINISIA